MYNVRRIEYPTGYQIRVYTRGVVGMDDGDPYPNVDWIDYVNGDVHLKSGNPIPYDVWLDGSEWVESFDDLEEMENKRKAESVRVSASRCKNNLYYIARSNVWEWFVTLTIAPSDRIDRYDYDECSAKVRKWFNHLKERKAPDLYYLIVPEQHKDGAWHYHALIGGADGLTFVDSGHVDKDSGEMIWNFEDWKYGFSTATKVQSTQRVSSYISKYITKDLCRATKGKHRFWASKTCQRASVEDYLVDGEELVKYRQTLMENMSYKSAVDTAYFRVEYFEIPKGGKSDS